MTGLMLLLFSLSRTMAAPLTNSPVSQILLENSKTFTISKDFIREMQETESAKTEPLPFQFWGEKSNGLAENPTFSRQTAVVLLYLTGDSDFLFPPNITKGNIILKEGDTEGCLLDERTADLLFGSSNPIGGALICDGREVTIRGILTGIKDTVILQATADSMLNHISLSIPPGKDSVSTAESFLNRHNLTGHLLHHNWISLMGQIGSGILPLFLFLNLLTAYGHLLFTCRRYPVLSLLWFFLLLLIVTGFFWITSLKPSLPQSMIPTRWSDFSFWKEMAEYGKENLEVLLMVPKDKLYLLKLQRAAGAFITGFACMVCFPFSVCQKACHTHSTKSFIRCLLCIMVLSWFIFYGWILLHPQENVSGIAEKKVWFLLPGYMALRRIGRWEH